MSITIYNDVESNWKEKPYPCYCVERSEDGSVHEALTAMILRDDFRPEVIAKVKSGAESNCQWCKGEGVTITKDWAPPTDINWNEANAAAVFNALGIVDPNKQTEMSLPEIRRALIKALNSKSLNQFTRPEEKIYGKLREIEPGIVDMKPVRVWSQGLDEDGVRSRLEKLMKFVSESIQQGATKIYWG
jgi:hypothetical protein